MVPGVAARFPQAGLATPHYLASAAGAAVLARGGNAVDAIVARQPRARRRRAVLLRLRRRHLRRSSGTASCTATSARAARRPARRSTRCATRSATTPLLVGPHSVTVPGAIAGWFELLERWGTMSVRRAGARRDPVRPRGLRAHADGRGCGAGLPRLLPRTSTEWQAVYGGARRSATFCVQDPPRAAHRAARRRTGPTRTTGARSPRRSPPRSQRHGGLMTPTTSPRTPGSGPRRCVRAYRDVEVAELPPPTQGVGGARDPAHPRRLRPALRMDPADRAHLVIEAVKLGLRDRDDHVTRPGRTAVSPHERSTPTTGSRRGATRSTSNRAQRAGPRAPAARRHRVPLRGRRRRAAGQPDPVELPRRSAPACTCPSGGSTSTTAARRSRSTRRG